MISPDDKKIFYLSLLSLGYFVILMLNAYLFHIDWIIIGILQEVLTLPFFCGQFILLFFSVRSLKREGLRLKSSAFWSAILLTLSVTAISFSLMK